MFRRELRKPLESPQDVGIEDVYVTRVVENLIMHVLRAAGAVTAFAIPETDESYLLGSPCQRAVKLPEVVAGVRIGCLVSRAKLLRHDKELRVRIGLHLIESFAPIVPANVTDS